MTSMLFRAGKSLLVGEAQNKAGHVWHLELRCEITESGPVPLVAETVQVPESMIVNPSYEIFLNSMDESAPTRRFRDVVHESIVPFIASGREVNLGARTIVAYERDRRGLALREGENVAWSSMNEAFGNLDLAETLALEGIRSKLVERGLVEAEHQGRVTESYRRLTGVTPVYMKINPFRDKTLLRPGTEVCPVGYCEGCVTVEADGEEFWAPVEEADFYSEERKSDMWYFKQSDGNDALPDPLTALPSKVALRTTAKDRRRGSLQWDPKADTRKVIGHLTPEKEVENNHSVMGESFEGTFLHHFFYLNRYNTGALGGSDMRTQEPAVKRDKDVRDQHGNKHLRDHPRSEAPKPYEYDGTNAEPEIDDGTCAQFPDGPMVLPATESVEALVNSILRGASVTAIFAERLAPEREEELRKEQIQKVFPGSQKIVKPALDSPQVGP